jgi:AraC-like DNA-binding protein/quercetin dioxygenase-like cupin family protein
MPVRGTRVQPVCRSAGFHGDVRQEARVAGFTLTETVYARGEHIPRHAHACVHFCLVLRGGYTECYGAHSREYGPTAVVFHPEGEVHSNRFHGSGGRLFRVVVPEPAAARLREAASLSDDRAFVVGGVPARLAARLYREFREPDSLSPLVAEGLILELLGLAARGSPDPGAGAAPQWLCRAADLLRDRFRENLSLGEVARAAGVHPAYLARVFRRHFRCSAGEYVRQLRVEHARRELSRGDAPLAEIALEAGFSDQSHLTNVFRRHTGLTPAAYRKLFRTR